jgi:hypothetical protein
MNELQKESNTYREKIMMIKIKMYMCLIKHQAMKTYRRVEVTGQPHASAAIPSRNMRLISQWRRPKRFKQ